MIRISITAEAFAAVERTLTVGNVSVAREATETGERQIWLELHIVDKLRHLRGPGESFNDVILKLAGEGQGQGLTKPWAICFSSARAHRFAREHGRRL
ncbi:MAG TPA: hypothetical protein VGG86_20205 [Roseiarcus sp.]|jgi:hypothetical protein